MEGLNLLEKYVKLKEETKEEKGQNEELIVALGEAIQKISEVLEKASMKETETETVEETEQEKEEEVDL